MSRYAYWLANAGLTAHQLFKWKETGMCAQELYGLSETALDKMKVFTQKEKEKLIEAKRGWNLEKQWIRLQEEGVGFVSLEDKDYPDKLRNIPNPPFALYFRGTLPNPDRKRVAIVGARGRSAYGSQITDQFACVLAQNQVDIISGMALGIDTDAHTGALKGKGETFAVLGCGVDVCYPKSNRYLYEKIMTCGAVLSEYPPKTPPRAAYFPQRNRIISGLSDYVLVMEARKKSGSLITADYAMEQGREVYALPGRVTDELSEGTNHLIQQGAGILIGIEDFLKEMQIKTSDIVTQLNFRKNLLENDESLVYALLNFYPVGLGTMIEKTPYGLAELLPVLQRLEQKGFIREAVPNYYIKTV